ncbi:hypothetical protein ACGFT2_15000 [Streptomyces sp. NPDC048514]|uniref:hypothetical protein n=1 Tax=Streptomyces sp. NPDC048514 TaxID=3365564 RepID=UPI003716F88D
MTRMRIRVLMAAFASAAALVATTGPAHAEITQTEKFTCNGDWKVVANAFNLFWPVRWDVDVTTATGGTPAAKSSTVQLKEGAPPFFASADFTSHVEITAAPAPYSQVVLRCPSGHKVERTFYDYDFNDLPINTRG